MAKHIDMSEMIREITANPESLHEAVWALANVQGTYDSKLRTMANAVKMLDKAQRLPESEKNTKELSRSIAMADLVDSLETLGYLKPGEIKDEGA